MGENDRGLKICPKINLDVDVFKNPGSIYLNPSNY